MNLSRKKKATPKTVRVTNSITNNSRRSSDNNISENLINNDLINVDEGASSN